MFASMANGGTRRALIGGSTSPLIGVRVRRGGVGCRDRAEPAEDDEESDVDLAFVMGRPLSLMELGRLEDEVVAAVGVPCRPGS